MSSTRLKIEPNRLRQCQTPNSVPSSDRRFLAARRQLLEGKLTQGLQHDEAWLTVRTCLLAQQTLVQKRGDTLERVALRFTPSARDGLRRLEGEAPGEDREAPEEHLLLRRQQVVTPGDGVPHRLLPFRDITSASGQQRQPVLEPGKQGCWRKHFDPRGGQFDGEGKAVHAPTDLGDGDGVLRGQGEIGLDGLRARRRRAERRRTWQRPRRCDADPSATRPSGAIGTRARRRSGGGRGW